MIIRVLHSADRNRIMRIQRSIVNEVNEKASIRDPEQYIACVWILDIYQFQISLEANIGYWER